MCNAADPQRRPEGGTIVSTVIDDLGQVVDRTRFTSTTIIRADEKHGDRTLSDVANFKFHPVEYGCHAVIVGLVQGQMTPMIDGLVLRKPL